MSGYFFFLFFSNICKMTFFDTQCSCGTICQTFCFPTTAFRDALAAERSRGFDFTQLAG